MICGKQLPEPGAICARPPGHQGTHHAGGDTGLGFEWLTRRPSYAGNLHRVVVTETRLECWEFCTGSEPHIREFRALDVKGG